jgi:hypothetical protein
VRGWHRAGRRNLGKVRFGTNPNSPRSLGYAADARPRAGSRQGSNPADRQIMASNGPSRGHYSPTSEPVNRS